MKGVLLRNSGNSLTLVAMELANEQAPMKRGDNSSQAEEAAQARALAPEQAGIL